MDSSLSENNSLSLCKLVYVEVLSCAPDHLLTDPELLYETRILFWARGGGGGNFRLSLASKEFFVVKLSRDWRKTAPIRLDYLITKPRIQKLQGYSHCCASRFGSVSLVWPRSKKFLVGKKHGSGSDLLPWNSGRYAYSYEVQPHLWGTNTPTRYSYIYEIQLHLWDTATVHLREQVTPTKYTTPTLWTSLTNTISDGRNIRCQHHHLWGTGKI